MSEKMIKMTVYFCGSQAMISETCEIEKLMNEVKRNIDKKIPYVGYNLAGMGVIINLHNANHISFEEVK